jgi:16S rRNA (adenine1518-N6/adenine1519-N6)-dimethyltransferase
VARAKRRLGQHFLADPRILARIADALGAGSTDTVLEIGPGPGGLTEALMERAGRLIAIEKDRDLIPALRLRVPRAEVIQGDALELDWRRLVQPPYLLAGNIPYNITSPLLDQALRPPAPERIVFLVQKEVADRVIAPAGASEYGALTVGIRVTAQAERLFTVAAGAFQPRPKVDSAVLRLTPLREPLIAEAERESFRTLVVGLFGFRRKQMLRALRELTGWDAARISPILQGLGIVATARPEVVTPEEFVQLHHRLVDGGWRAGVAL